MSDTNPRLPLHAATGTGLTARSWQTEAPLRMLMNNLDPEVAEDPDHLVVYGGTGRAARSWEAYDAIVASDTAAEWLGGISAETVARQIRSMSGDLELRINSPGGDVFAARAIEAAMYGPDTDAAEHRAQLLEALR